MFSKFDTQIEVFIDEGKKFMGSFKSCVKKH